MAFSAGAVAVQYRNKSFDPQRDLDELKAIATLARQQKKVLIINDDAALAFQVGAQGVHLGQEDGSVDAARELLGPTAIIGATVHSHAELQGLSGASVDYIGVGPVYGTRSKVTGLPDLGLAGLSSLCQASPFPVIGIGSIRRDNAGAVLAAGAVGIAVISEFCTASQPHDIALQLLDILAGDRPPGTAG